MKPFNLITWFEPQHTKRYQWAKHILGYEANRRRFKQKVQREAWAMSNAVEGSFKPSRGLSGRSLRPPTWKMFKRESLLSLLLP